MDQRDATKSHTSKGGLRYEGLIMKKKRQGGERKSKLEVEEFCR